MAEAGWYQDPMGGDRLRFFDGATWTEHLRARPPAMSPLPRDRDMAMSSTQVTLRLPAGLDAAKAALIGGALLMMLGSILPWLRVTAPFVGSFTVNGTDAGNDGILTLLLGLGLGLGGVLAVFLPAVFLKRWPWALHIALAGIASAIVLYDMVEAERRILDANRQSNLISANLGVGIFITALGAGVALTVAILRLIMARPPRPI